jgi:DNA-binding transcriptional ArsR family regulator
MTAEDQLRFQPVAFQIVDSPEQLKAFIDPLRNRALAILCEHEATNQQLARALGEPHAKVLHHVRALLDAGLIVLVETRIKGGNVEKYYRAVARMFGIRPSPDLLPAVVGGELQALSQEVAASAAIWPERGEAPNWEGRSARMSRERLREFTRRLQALIAEYWGGPTGPDGPLREPPDDATGELWSFSSVVYRNPLEQSNTDG